MKNGLRAVRRVLGSRWISGFATAAVLFAVFAAAGVPWGGVGNSSGAQGDTFGRIRVQFPSLPLPEGQHWIELESFQWAIEGSSTRPASGPPRTSEIVITKVVDRASPELHMSMARGEHHREVTIQFCERDCSKTTPYMQIVLEDALISSYSLSSGGDRPTETLSLNFEKINVEYIEQDKTGEVRRTVGWDCADWPYCTAR